MWPTASPYASALYPIEVMEEKTVIGAFVRR